MRRFQEAWEAVDIDGIVALLTDDALLTMPPESRQHRRCRRDRHLLRDRPHGGPPRDRIRLPPARANGQPALAAYADEHETTNTHDAYGVMVFAIDGDTIVGITGFPDRPELFKRLGLPVALPA